MDSIQQTSKNSLLPPNVKISAPSSRSSSSSATGNPRNKCALKPGHSLMDWIRLGNTPGVDLSGTKGKRIPVSREELAKHNKRNDAWMAIGGMVYNVTRYMDFHPGGVDELMRGIGIDATKLFEEVHAWVNYPQLLGKCLVGPLINTARTRTTSNQKSISSESLHNLLTIVPSLKEVVPRLDWTQKTSQLTFYIYTKQFCNPGLVVLSLSDKCLLFKVQIDGFHEFKIDLYESVDWPPNNISISSESGKIEISFRKSIEGLWTTYGSHTINKLSSSEYDEAFLYKIARKEKFNHDSFEMLASSEKKILVVPPLGFHLFIKTKIEGAEISRSYTPVAKKFLKSSNEENNGQFLYFLIKKYENGLLSNYLSGNSEVSFEVSLPKGNFCLSNLTKHRNILFLAAGSGLTPFLNLLDPLMKRSTNRLDYLKLVYFNKTEDDIWCRDTLENLAKNDERFQVTHILSQPSSDWKMFSGRLTKDLLSSFVATKENPRNCTFVAVCGPQGFNQLAETYLQELQFKDDCYHIFR